MLYWISFLFFAGRFLIPSHTLSWPGTYEAFAHIWCGVLITLGCQGKKQAWLALGIITVLEIIMSQM